MIEFNNIKYYSREELSDILKCSVSSVIRYLKTNNIPVKRFGRKLYVNSLDIQKLLS